MARVGRSEQEGKQATKNADQGWQPNGDAGTQRNAGFFDIRAHYGTDATRGTGATKVQTPRA